jgi:hypothetical protein
LQNWEAYLFVGSGRTLRRPQLVPPSLAAVEEELDSFVVSKKPEAERQADASR